MQAVTWELEKRELQKLHASGRIVQAWVFQPWVKAIIDKHLKELAEAPKPTIAFHVRWGDKIEEDILLVTHLAHPRPHIQSDNA